jgi:LysR family cys regulon transcriptional activator
MYEFVERFAPHLTADIVDAAAAARTPEDQQQLFADIDLPVC